MFRIWLVVILVVIGLGLEMIGAAYEASCLQDMLTSCFFSE